MIRSKNKGGDMRLKVVGIESVGRLRKRGRGDREIVREIV